MRSLNCLNITSKSIKNISSFASWNSDCMVHILSIILNHCMLWSWVINHLFITCNKQLFTDRMLYAIFFIFRNNFYIDTADWRKFQCSKNWTTLRCCNKSLCRLWKYYGWTMNISLLAVLILKNCILKTLKCDSISDIIVAICSLWNNLNTCWWHIERYFCTLDNQKLTYKVFIFLVFDFLTFCIYNSS